MLVELPELAGLAGFALYMGSYALLNAGLLDGRSYGYAAMNLAAAVCVLVSLTEAFNLASALIQAAWIAISLFGLVRLWHERRSGSL
jgi:hypothetical protein